MSTLKTFLESKKISAKHVAIASNRTEAWKDGDDVLREKRAAKRRNEPEKKYAELEIGKPNTGRGVSEKNVEAAVAGKAVPRKVRAKILRAVNTILTTKKQPVVEMKALWEGSEVRKGKGAEKKEDAAKK
jgi:hypothetical protein